MFHTNCSTIFWFHKYKFVIIVFKCIPFYYFKTHRCLQIIIIITAITPPTRIDDIFNIIQECAEEIDELKEARKKKVIRKGKLVRKTFCKPGQKAKGGRCVAMKSTERTRRKLKAKKSATKRRGKMSRIKKKRAKAMKKRKAFGLR